MIMAVQYFFPVKLSLALARGYLVASSTIFLLQSTIQLEIALYYGVIYMSPF